MSIEGWIVKVSRNRVGRGYFHIYNKDRRDFTRLYFDKSPPTIERLTNLNIWGGGSSLLIGEIEIARRIGYSRIEFLPFLFGE